jgi:hypothetical protein
MRQRSICGEPLKIGVMTRNAPCLRKFEHSGKHSPDLVGTHFGRLTVVRESRRARPGGSRRWLCQCRCGRTVTVTSYNLLNGDIRSCKCLRRALLRARNKRKATHGRSTSPVFSSWTAMCYRCSNPNNMNYGGANPPVIFCDGLALFQSFLAHLGERPANTSLGRYLDSGNYTCGGCSQCHKENWLRNCEWQTPAEQAAERIGKHVMLRFHRLRHRRQKTKRGKI